jgi:hypothetical protein
MGGCEYPDVPVHLGILASVDDHVSVLVLANVRAVGKVQTQVRQCDFRRVSSDTYVH